MEVRRQGGALGCAGSEYVTEAAGQIAQIVSVYSELAEQAGMLGIVGVGLVG